MSSRIEEYKILKEETKSYTAQLFRDFQIFIGIITIFYAVISSKDIQVPKFASYCFMHIAVFIFISIQFNRAIYLLVVRKHLSKLENLMNQEFDKSYIFEWESKIVPNEIANKKSYTTISQVIISLTYFLILIWLWLKSNQHLASVKKSDLIISKFWFYPLSIIELAFIIYSLVYLVKNRNGQTIYNLNS